MGAQPEVSMATMEVTGVGKRHPPQNFCDAKIITASWQLRGRGRACCSTGALGGPTRGHGDAAAPHQVPWAFAGLPDRGAQRPGRPRVLVSPTRLRVRVAALATRAHAPPRVARSCRAAAHRVFASLSSGCQCSDPPPWKMRLLSAPGCGSHKGRFTKTALSPGYHPGSTRPAGRLTDQVRVAE